MDTLLAQMEAQNSVQRLQAVDSTENLRWMNAQRPKNTFGRGVQPRTPGNSRPVTPRQQQTSGKQTTCDYCHALGKDEKIWSTHDKLNCFALFPEKRKPRVNARMLSVPVYTDQNETWDLQDAFDAVENQFYAMSVNSDESGRDPLSPQ